MFYGKEIENEVGVGSGEWPDSQLNSPQFASSCESLVSMSSESISLDNGIKMVTVKADISDILKNDSPLPWSYSPAFTNFEMLSEAFQHHGRGLLDADKVVHLQKVGRTCAMHLPRYWRSSCHTNTGRTPGVQTLQKHSTSIPTCHRNIPECTLVEGSYSGTSSFYHFTQHHHTMITLCLRIHQNHSRF